LSTQAFKATFDARPISLASNKTSSSIISEKKYTISIILELVATLGIDTTLSMKTKASSIRRSYNRELLTLQSPYMFVVSIKLTLTRRNSF